MSAFSAALGRIFGNPAMAIPALWVSAATSEERAIRVIARAPDQITPFGPGRVLSESITVDVRVVDLPEPRPGDVIVIDDDSHVIQGEPQRDRERLVWTLDLRPA